MVPVTKPSESGAETRAGSREGRLALVAFLQGIPARVLAVERDVALQSRALLALRRLRHMGSGSRDRWLGVGLLSLRVNSRCEVSSFGSHRLEPWGWELQVGIAKRGVLHNGIGSLNRAANVWGGLMLHPPRSCLILNRKCSLKERPDK